MTYTRGVGQKANKPIHFRFFIFFGCKGTQIWNRLLSESAISVLLGA